MILTLPKLGFPHQKSELPPTNQASQPDDELSRSTNWSQPSGTELEQRILQGLGLQKKNPDIKNQAEIIRTIVSHAKSKTALDLAIQCICEIRPDIKRRIQQLELSPKTSLPAFEKRIEDADESEFIRNHLQLHLARWLAQNTLYDESLGHLERLHVQDVVDPASLLYYKGLMQHQLFQKEACVKTLTQLLQRPSSLPKRFEVLSRLMLADIQPVKEDSLDAISRIMEDIRRRTSLNRSGKIVLNREKQVIEKLDKLIEQLESDQQLSQQSQGNANPAAPMQDSQQAAGKGSGNVTSKKSEDGGAWGDLPPAERAAALAEMAKDMPPHYREVIEEYFRRMAQENDR